MADVDEELVVAASLWMLGDILVIKLLPEFDDAAMNSVVESSAGPRTGLSPLKGRAHFAWNLSAVFVGGGAAMFEHSGHRDTSSASKTMEKILVGMGLVPCPLKGRAQFGQSAYGVFASDNMPQPGRRDVAAALSCEKRINTGCTSTFGRHTSGVLPAERMGPLWAGVEPHGEQTFHSQDVQWPCMRRQQQVAFMMTTDHGH